jgi:hypothetical protein
VQRATQLAGRTLTVEFGRNGVGIGIEFDDGIDAWTGLVDGGDARQVALDELLRADLARSHGGRLLLHAGVEQFARAHGPFRRGRGRPRNPCRTGNGAGCHTQSNEIPAIHASSLLLY